MDTLYDVIRKKKEKPIREKLNLQKYGTATPVQSIRLRLGNAENPENFLIENGYTKNSNGFVRYLTNENKTDYRFHVVREDDKYYIHSDIYKYKSGKRIHRASQYMCREERERLSKIALESLIVRNKLNKERIKADNLKQKSMAEYLYNVQKRKVIKRNVFNPLRYLLGKFKTK